MKCVVCKLKIDDGTPFDVTPIGNVHIGECSTYYKLMLENKRLTESVVDAEEVESLFEDVQMLVD